jgi:multidrug transporter EmrE-like cation transporter
MGVKQMPEVSRRFRAADYILILLPLLLMVIGQIMTKMGAAAGSFVNTYIILGYTALLARGLAWVFVLKRLPVSFAYPVMSISFVLILFASHYFFDETFTVYKVTGSLLIIAGATFTSLGKLAEDRE